MLADSLSESNVACFNKQQAISKSPCTSVLNESWSKTFHIKRILIWMKMNLYAGLSSCFESSIALFSTPTANLLLYGWILWATGNFTCNIKGESCIHSRNRCYGLQPLMTALVVRQPTFIVLVSHKDSFWHRGNV